MIKLYKYSQARSSIIHAIILFLAITVVTTIVLKENAFAQRLNYYANCRLNHEGNEGPLSGIGDTYLGYNAQCQEKCSKQCQNTFGLRSAKSKEDIETADPNQDTINNCIASCSRGETFAGRTIEEQDGYIYGPLAYVQGCTTKQNEVLAANKQGKLYKINVHNETIDLSSESVRVVVDINPSHENTIYTCGRKTVTMSPIFPNIRKMVPETTEGSSSYADVKNDRLYDMQESSNTLSRIKRETRSTQREIDTSLESGVHYYGGGVLYEVGNQIFEDMASRHSPPREWRSVRDQSYSRPDSTEPRMQHQCLAALTQDEWDSMSGEKLLQCQTDQNGDYKNCPILPYLQTKNVEMTCDENGQCTMQADPLNKALPASCYPGWHVRNPGMTKTGIVLAAGDEISMIVSGNILVGTGECAKSVEDVILGKRGSKYSYYHDSKTRKFFSFYNEWQKKANTSIIGTPGPDASFKKFIDNKQCSASFTKYEDFSIRNKHSNINIEKRKKVTDADQASYRLCGPSAMSVDCDSWQGLSCKINDSGTYLPRSDPSSFGEDDEAQSEEIGCDDKIIDTGSEQYFYNGKYTPSSSSSESAELLLGMPYKNTDNIKLAGGYEVKIDWRGKVIRDGEEVQVAFIEEREYEKAIERARPTSSGDVSTPGPSVVTEFENLTWSSEIGELLSSGKTYKKNAKEIRDMAGSFDGKKFKMLFRIPLKSSKADLYNSIKPGYCDYRDQMGAYKIGVKIYGSKESDWFMDLIKNMRRTLYGDNPCNIEQPCDLESGKCGVIGGLYRAVVQNVSKLASVILLLYMSIFGISFASGIIQINAREMLTRLAKVAVVVTVTMSAQSWNAVGSKLVAFSVCGTERLIYVMTGGSGTSSSDGTMEEALSQTDSNIDSLFNIDRLKMSRSSGQEVEASDIVGGIGTMFSSIFNSTLGAKLVALIFSGVTGAATAGIIAFALFSMAVFLINVVLNYLFSIAVLGLFSILTPVILPLILFDQTKEIFHGFVKQFMVSMLSPILAFVTYAFCMSVLLNLTYAMLNFTVCKSCLISLPIADYCLISSWSILTMSHTSSLVTDLPTFSPIGIMLAAVSALLVVTTAGAILNKIGDILGRIIQVRPIGSKQGAAGTMGMVMATMEPFDEIKGRATGAAMQLMKRDIPGFKAALSGRVAPPEKAADSAGVKEKTRILNAKDADFGVKNEDIRKD